jgi:hypothetical protein
MKIVTLDILGLAVVANVTAGYVGLMIIAVQPFFPGRFYVHFN